MHRAFLLATLTLFALAGWATSGLADDKDLCLKGSAADENASACSRLLSSNTLTGRDLAQVTIRSCYLYARRGDDNFDRAISDCTAMLRLEPNNGYALAYRAASYVRKDNFDAAEADLNQALRLVPQDTGVRSVAGYFHFMRGDNDRAMAELTEALRLNPKNASAFRTRGLVWESKGDYSKALADFRTALRSDPDKKETLGREAADGIARMERKLAAVHPSSTPGLERPKDSPQPRRTGTGTPRVDSARRIALVVGNAKYPDAEPPISQPTKDAQALADELRKSGYDVALGENLTKQGLQQAIDTFKAKITPGSVVLLFFSGYGIQADRRTYLLPVDAQVWAEKDVSRDGFNVEALLTEINDKGAGEKLIIIDAARRNPYERRFRGVSIGLAPVTTPAGTLVMYAAAPGKVTNDESGRFITELVKEVRAPAIAAEEAFIRTRIGVSKATNGEQIPWISSSLTTELTFAAPGK